MAERATPAGPANAAGYRLLVLIILLSLTVSRMLQRGMFLDGVTYAAISRNLAIGVGSIWAPVYTDTFYASFFEQPPLGFALEALAFSVLGDHVYVERVFSLGVFLLHALMIAGVWRQLLPREYDWLPHFFWVLPAVVTWATINNMLEGTQSLITTSAVYALLRARAALSSLATLSWSATAGLAVVAATLVKGPVGMFPLAAVALLPFLQRCSRHRRSVHWSALVGGLAGSLVACGVLLSLAEAPRFAVAEFVRTHLAPALAGHRGDVWSLSKVTRHFVGIVSRIALAVGLLWAIRRRRADPAVPPVDPAAWFFLGTAAAASLPLLASPKLAGHYFLASVPFYALAAAATALPAIATFHRPAPTRWARMAPVAIAIGLTITAVVVATSHGTLEPRDRVLIGSFDAISAVIPRGETVGTCAMPNPDWGLVAYGQRFYRLSLAPTGAPANGWFLLPVGACSPPGGCHVAAAGTSLKLYRCESARAHDATFPGGLEHAASTGGVARRPRGARSTTAVARQTRGRHAGRAHAGRGCWLPTPARAPSSCRPPA